MRWFGIILFAGLGISAWWTWNNNSNVRDFVQQVLDNRDILTLETRFSPEQIIAANFNKLARDSQHSIQEPAVRFYPYLLMDVKYTGNDRRTYEGLLLWSLVDGEIVLDTENWETTHGFADCINSRACREDLIIMQAIASTPRGEISREELLKKLAIDPEQFEELMASAKDKHLVTQQGPLFTLHFENPKIHIQPQTRIAQPLVTKSYSHALRARNFFSPSQLEKMARVAFGNDFTIRSSREIYLPVYSIEVLNPDGSILTTYWNALSGRQMKTNIF